jgi:hypothetical protein
MHSRSYSLLEISLFSPGLQASLFSLKRLEP